MARLEPVVAAFRELNEVREQLAGARQMRDSETDEEIRAMARDEISALEARETALVDDLRVSLLPRDPNDDRNVIVEIRAGAGRRGGRAVRARSCCGCTAGTRRSTSSGPT